MTETLIRPSFFGFYPTDTVAEKEAYIEATSEGIELYVNNEHIINIDWIFHFLDKNPTDYEIWDYIMSECKKHTNIEQIFIDRVFSDNYVSLTCVFSEDYPDDTVEPLPSDYDPDWDGK